MCGGVRDPRAAQSKDCMGGASVKLGCVGPHYQMACYAAFLMHIADALSPHLCMQLSIGLHSGPVHCGVIGGAAPRFAMFGDTLVTAMSLQVCVVM